MWSRHWFIAQLRVRLLFQYLSVFSFTGWDSGSLRFTDSFLPVQVCGYFIYTQAIGSRKGLRPWPPRRAINLDCISVHLLSSRCASRFPRTPRQTDRRLSSAKTFLWVFMFLWSSFFFGFWLAAIYKFTCCMPLALFWLPVSDRTF